MAFIPIPCPPLLVLAKSAPDDSMWICRLHVAVDTQSLTAISLSAIFLYSTAG